MNIENFSLKGVTEKCVGCFLVYQFYGSFFFRKKRYYMIQGLKFRIKPCNQVAPFTTTFHDYCIIKI